MTTAPASIGRSTGGKPINLAQLQTELAAAGVDVGAGLGLTEAYVHSYGFEGEPADFPEAEQATVDQTIAAHVAMRDKTSAEYATEFQNPDTPPARKQEIRDIQNGLLPPEQVPMP
jgi:hypothetical protein